MALSSLAVTGVAAQESTPDATPTPEITPAPDARRLELTLQELNDSGVSGTATLYDAGERTIVVIDAEGTGENHPSHIHAGRCDNLTPNVGYPLENVSGDEPTTSVVDVALDNLLANEFAVDLHLAPNELGTLIACAEIEGEPVTPEGAATPTTAPTEATPAATPPSDGTGGVATQTPAPAETPAPTETEAAATEPVAETPAATEAATPVPEESDGTGGAINDDQNAASLPLFTQGESGVTGTAVLTADGEQTLISILLSGDAVTSGHIVHLHDGTCAAPGDFTQDLNPIEGGSVSESLVDIPFQNLLNDGYFINVHESEANWDNWFVCGDLTSATVGVVVPEVAPPTGGGERPTPTPAPTEVAVTTPAPTAVAVTTPPAVEGDGTAGLSGKGTPIGETTSLPQSAGVGASLAWPRDPLMAVIWASAIGAIVLGAGAWLIRRGERHTSHNPTRWTRLGI